MRAGKGKKQMAKAMDTHTCFIAEESTWTLFVVVMGTLQRNQTSRKGRIWGR